MKPHKKIVFTREELNRNSGKPCYILEFYTAKKQYSYKVDAKNGSIMELTTSFFWRMRRKSHWTMPGST